MFTTSVVAMVSSKPFSNDIKHGFYIETGDRKIKEEASSSADNILQEDKVASNGNSEAWGHEIRKRSPVTPFFPLAYKFCALQSKSGAILLKKIGGPLGIAYSSVALTAFLAKICPLWASWPGLLAG